MFIKAGNYYIQIHNIAYLTITETDSISIYFLDGKQIELEGQAAKDFTAQFFRLQDRDR